MKDMSLVAQLCLTLCNPTDCSPPGSSVHRNSLDKNTGVGCHSLLQGIFPTQGSNPGLLHYRQILYQRDHKGSPYSTIYMYIYISSGFPGSISDKKPSCQYSRLKRRGFDLWIGKIPWNRKWQPALVFLPGKFHGQRSLAGYSPCGHKELEMTEQLSTHIHD